MCACVCPWRPETDTGYPLPPLSTFIFKAASINLELTDSSRLAGQRPSQIRLGKGPFLRSFSFSPGTLSHPHNPAVTSTGQGWLSHFTDENYARRDGVPLEPTACVKETKSGLEPTFISPIDPAYLDPFHQQHPLRGPQPTSATWAITGNVGAGCTIRSGLLFAASWQGSATLH